MKIIYGIIGISICILAIIWVYWKYPHKPGNTLEQELPIYTGTVITTNLGEYPFDGTNTFNLQVETQY